MKQFALCWLIMLSMNSLLAQQKHPLTFDDFISLGRVTDPQVSPDGKNVVFVITVHNKNENKTNSNLYIISSDGGSVRPLTAAKGANNTPRWMPDGSSIAFISTRDGDAQIWSVPAGGGEARKISAVSTGISDLQVSPDGRWFSYVSEIFPDCPTDESNRLRHEEIAKAKSKAKIFDKLPFRVWNAWKDGMRSHVFILPAVGGAPRDMTPGDFDSPPIDLGGTWSYAWSPDASELAFTRNPDPVVAISTNNDIYVAALNGGEARKLTDNPGNDSQPLYSPDGKYLAYLQMKRAGFEADQQQLVLYNRASGTRKNVTGQIDYSINDFLWAPDSKTIYFNADDKGNESLFRLDIGSGTMSVVADKGYNHSIGILPDGKGLILLKESINHPADLFRIDLKGNGLKRLTSINDDRLRSIDMNPKEDFWFEGADGAKLHGFIVKPAGFDASKKYPAVLLIHGGPQGQWGDQFHYRWSAQMFASRGLVVVLINPHGSTGYGQKFTDEISGDWGGEPYEDLMKGMDAALKAYPFLDGTRVAAAGASYGGYMINWIAGHTTRFRCLVSHDGTFNMSSVYGTTDELWFPEWEFRGTPYQHPELYDKWSPSRFAANFKTPMLVVHGQLDYRLDVSEGFQLFTALQRQGVKSKMLYFPDEGHFVTKPANAEVWYKTVLDWIEENTK